ncbi:hypothetical protein G7Y79_00049g085180 [Physcia stellaris]|nr:hypothetical protein G7Y79_00049g085180 [Physcia stellaris]
MDNDMLHLSPLDHIMPRKHTFRLFYFPTSSSHDPHHRHHPEIRSQLTIHGSPSPRGRLVLRGPSHPVDELFRVKDLTASSHSYNSLRLQGFPIRAFRFEDVLTIASERGDIYGVEKPVMLAQLNFLDGGFVLGVCLHHSVLDGTACVEVMRTWANFCGGAYGEVKIGPAQVDRSSLLHPPGKPAALSRFPEFRELDPEEQKKRLTKPIPTTHLAIYHFPPTSLTALKSLLSPPSPPAWISTNDALCALLFSCLATALTPHPLDSSSLVPLAINLDARTLFPALPHPYLGNAVLHAQFSASYAELLPSVPALAHLAARIRGRLEEVRGEGYAKGFLAAVHGVENVVAGFLPLGVLVAPWQGQGFYGIEWGGMRIERMRAACEEGVREGVCQIYPRIGGRRKGWRCWLGWVLRLGRG